MSQPPEPVIVARGLTKRFGELVAVNELSITVNRGDIYGFLGPNGSGKTTTIRMLLRLIRRNAGQIEILGKNLDEAPLEILGQVGALVEEPAFYPYLSGRQNLQAFGRLVGRVPKGRVDEVIELVGLKGRGNDKVTVYSQGMRQRLGIGQALLMRPKLLFLDEPTNGLDPPGIESMRLILRRLTE
ncbi:MAG: ABC transporter ATP-binding protein, partial [Planctomycetota bacterium]